MFFVVKVRVCESACLRVCVFACLHLRLCVCLLFCVSGSVLSVAVVSKEKNLRQLSRGKLFARGGRERSGRRDGPTIGSILECEDGEGYDMERTWR